MTRTGFQADVVNGRLTLDQPTDLPDGSVWVVASVPTAAECDWLLFFATEEEQKQLLTAAKDRGLEWRGSTSELGDFIDHGTVGRSRINAVRTKDGAIGWGSTGWLPRARGESLPLAWRPCRNASTSKMVYVPSRYSLSCCRKRLRKCRCGPHSRSGSQGGARQ